MKELSIEEKAKRYDEAIEKAGERYNEEYTSTLERSTLAYVFPELKESEGEKLREQVVYAINQLHVCECTKNKLKSWLEKQGEQKPADKVEPKFKVGDKIVENNGFGMIGGEITDIDDTHYELDGGGIYIPISHQNNYKLVEEQKLAWSEEDEEHLNSIISDIKTDMGAYPRSQEVIDIYNDDISFLKSLKERVQPQNLNVTDEELINARNEAYNDALDKLEYHSDTPTFNDGWSAAIWYLKTRIKVLFTKE